MKRRILEILPIQGAHPKLDPDGVLVLRLPVGGHYVLVVDQQKIDPELLRRVPLLPANATGGVIISVDGPPTKAIKFYRLQD